MDFNFFGHTQKTSTLTSESKRLAKEHLLYDFRLRNRSGQRQFCTTSSYIIIVQRSSMYASSSSFFTYFCNFSFSVDLCPICHDQWLSGKHICQFLHRVDPRGGSRVCGSVHRLLPPPDIWWIALAGVLPKSPVCKDSRNRQVPVVCRWTRLSNHGHTICPHRCHSC